MVRFSVLQQGYLKEKMQGNIQQAQLSLLTAFIDDFY